MRKEQDYTRDIAEIRSMMERSSKFLSLSGLAGVLAGIYALVGAYIAYSVYGFNPRDVKLTDAASVEIIYVAIIVLLLALGSAIYLSYRKGVKKEEKIWNATSRSLLLSMATPLVAGGILILVLIAKGLVGLALPVTLLFYGLALFNASQFSYGEVKYLGLIQIALGLVGAIFLEYSLLIWAIGFGVVHILYGIFIHIRHER